MEEVERFVALSHGLTACVVGLSEDARVGPCVLAVGNRRREECRAVLRVTMRREASLTKTRPAPSYRVELRWRTPTQGTFTVPGGTGQLSLSESGRLHIDATLQLQGDADRMAVETSLRLLLSLLLPSVGGLLIHASAVAINGKALVFLGRSGAGKTTTARRLCVEGASLLAEDLLILQGTSVEPCRFDAAGSAVWDAQVGTCHPLAAAYLVHKNAEISSVGQRAAMPFRTWSEAVFSARLADRLSGPFMETLAFVASKIPLYNFDAAIAGPLRPAFERGGRNEG